MTNELTRERVERAKERAEDQVELYRRALIDHKQKRDRPWAMWLEGEYEADLKYIERRIENYETFLALANAELERQSVTDEEIRGTIAILEDLKAGERNYYTESFSDTAYEIAIQALQAYRPVTVTWENTGDRPAAICSGCGNDLAIYDKYVGGVDRYCRYCGGRITEVRE